MQQQPAQNPPSRPIPQHVLERLESEWKQIRETTQQRPSNQS